MNSKTETVEISTAEPEIGNRLTFLQTTKKLFHQVRLYLAIVIILEMLVFAIGFIYSLQAPVIESSQHIGDPLSSIAYSSYMNQEYFIISVFGQNIFWQAVLLLTSILHLGLLILFSMLVVIFRFGATIGWFTQSPGLSFFDGITGYIGHALPEFAALTLTTVFSLWIGSSIIKAEQGKTKWETAKERYKGFLYIAPLVVILLLSAAAIEGKVSIPQAQKSMQKTLLAEESESFNDEKGMWTITLPVSWQPIHNDDASSDTLVSTFQSSKYPLALDVTTWETGNPAEYAAELEKSNKQIIGEASQALNQEGYELIYQEQKEMPASGRPALKLMFLENKPDTRELGNLLILFLIRGFNKEQQSMVSYQITFREKEYWSSVTMPLADRISQSFTINGMT